MKNMTSNPTKLSKNVLQMKFMQRSVLRMEEEQNEEEKQRVIDDEHWVLDLPQLAQREEQFVVQPSHASCQNVMFGRMSFQGFNPEVEKLMTLHNRESELQQAEEREKETEVSDVDMTNRYSALVGIISKKFQGKKRPSAQPVEQPSDEDDDDDEEELVHSPPKAKTKRQFMKPDDN